MKLPFEKKSGGFTLIELLVVISIISGLAALIMPNFMAVREKGKDTTRRADLRSLQQGLELYRQNQDPPLYPATLPTPGQCWSSNGGESSCTGDIVYIKKVPGDPVTKVSGLPLGYLYTPSADRTTYEICSCMDNTADPNNTAGDCLVDTYECPSGYKYVITQP